jgi:hypothetical protein
MRIVTLPGVNRNSIGYGNVMTACMRGGTQFAPGVILHVAAPLRLFVTLPVHRVYRRQCGRLAPVPRPGVVISQTR